MIEITVSHADWGNAHPEDIKALLGDVASHLTRPLRTPLKRAISVMVAPEPERDTVRVPMTCYRKSTQDPIVIQLAAKDTNWCQYAYQFSHELCHVISDYERLGEDTPNGWFHEAISELASVFTLRRMAERWVTNAPFGNWSDYARTLARYADDLLARDERQLPARMTLGEWLLLHEERLRSDRYQRDLNATAAYALLPVFESAPGGWNAVRLLPNSTETLTNYIRHWHSAVPDADQPFVLRIRNEFLPGGKH